MSVHLPDLIREIQKNAIGASKNAEELAERRANGEAGVCSEIDTEILKGIATIHHTQSLILAGLNQIIATIAPRAAQARSPIVIPGMRVPPNGGQ